MFQKLVIQDPVKCIDHFIFLCLFFVNLFTITYCDSCKNGALVEEHCVLGAIEHSAYVSLYIFSKLRNFFWKIRAINSFKIINFKFILVTYSKSRKLYKIYLNNTEENRIYWNMFSYFLIIERCQTSTFLLCL